MEERYISEQPELQMGQVKTFEHIRCLQETGFSLKQIKAMGERVAEVASLPTEKRTELYQKLSGEQRISEKDGLSLFRSEMTRWFSEMFQKNNEELSQKIEDIVVPRLTRELQFYMREQEEKEEERYKRFDRRLREFQSKIKQRQRVQ